MLRVGLICRIYPPHPLAGGISTYMRELAQGLAALGHDVHVFTESRVPVRRAGPNLSIHGRPPDPLPLLPGMPHTDRHLRWAVAATDCIATLGAGALDIVESANWGFEGLGVQRGGRLPVVVRLVTPLTVVRTTERWQPSADLDAAVSLERWSIAHANGLIGSTTAVLDTARETMRLESIRSVPCARIPLGIAPGPPPAPKPARPARLLFVGRLERRKGIHTLLEILPTLLDARPSLHGDVAGAELGAEAGPTARERFLAEHRRARWVDRVHFHGSVSEAALDALYAEATILVAPSLYESFGLIYLEAMRHGTPVIGCRAGGVPEVVHDGETGLLVPPDDPPALLAAITRLLDDPALRARLGAAGRRSVETEFSAQRMAERTAEFYREVLADVRRSRAPATAAARQP